MTDTIIQVLKSGESAFFSIGAFHLPGENGLVHKLKKAGIEVQQITR